MGTISKHGASPGSLVPVTILGPITVPPGIVHQLEDLKTTQADPALNGAFTVEQSNDNFGANIVEIDRSEMPIAGTFEDTPEGSSKIVGGSQVQWRVRLVQGAVGAATVTVRGTTGKTSGSPDAPDVLD